MAAHLRPLMSALTRYSRKQIKAKPELSSKELASMYGISRQSIADIRAGRTWRHIKAAEQGSTNTAQARGIS